MLVSEIEENLRSNKLFKFLWTETREGMAFVSREGVIQFANPALCRSLGYSSTELKGKPFSDITVTQDIEPDLSEFSKLLKEEITDYELVKSYNTKMRRTVTMKLRVVKFESGKLIFGQVLPVDSLSIDHLPAEDAKRVLAMLVGRWAIENWKLLLAVIGVITGIANIGEIIQAVAGGGK